MIYNGIKQYFYSLWKHSNHLAITALLYIQKKNQSSMSYVKKRFVQRRNKYKKTTKGKLAIKKRNAKYYSKKIEK